MSDRKKILLIDDEEDFCFFVKKNLEETGDFEVFVCCDSSKAIRQARELKPNLILLDILMPKVGGTDIAAELKNSEDIKDIPFIFLTAVVKEEETRKYKNIIGSRYFVEKPVKVNKLINIIKTVIK